MKLYLLDGVYYEKQADVPKHEGKFETIEFPFAASPKADFVSWLNDREIDELAGTCDCSALMNGDSDHSPSCPSYEPPTLAPPSEVIFELHGERVLDWVFDKATPAEIENLFTALGTRFHEAIR